MDGTRKRSFQLLQLFYKMIGLFSCTRGNNNCLLILNLVISRSAIERKNTRRKIHF